MANHSRREFLKRMCVLLLPAALPWFPAPGIAADASGKQSKDEAHYRLVGWNGGINCRSCRFFKRAENTMCMGMMDARCQLVAGSISPMGYCDLFAPFPPTR